MKRIMLLLVCLLALVACSKQKKSFDVSVAYEQIDKALLEINKSLPIEQGELKIISAERQKNNIVFMVEANTDINTFNQHIEQDTINLRRGLCNEKDRKQLMKAGINFVYRYTILKDHHIVEIKTTYQDCNSSNSFDKQVNTASVR